MNTQEKLYKLVEKCRSRQISFLIYFKGTHDAAWKISTYSEHELECFTTGDWNNIEDAIDDTLDFLFSINTREDINKRLEQAVLITLLTMS